MAVFITDRALAARFGVSRPTIWRWAKSGSGFPRPVLLSPGCSRWKMDEIESWESALQGAA